MIKSHDHDQSASLRMGGTKSRNGEMRNEKLEMRKWKRKWKWSSLLLVDNTEVDAIVYLWCIKRSVVKVLFVKIIDTIIDLLYTKLL